MILIYLLIFYAFQTFGFSIYATVAVTLFSYYLTDFIVKVNEQIAFRQLILVLFGLNFLFSPALMYNGLEDFQYYRMGLDEKSFFELAIPSMLLLQLGLYFFSTNIFQPNVKLLKVNASLIHSNLTLWVIIGIVIRVVLGRYLPGDVGFLFGLIANIRYVGAFGLLLLDINKYKYYIASVYLGEFYLALANGMFHDLTVLLMFTALLFAYLYKPNIVVKLGVLLIGVLVLFVVQLTKSDYRTKISENSSGVSTFINAASLAKANSENGLFDKHNIASSFTRVNQSWILANTIQNMDRTLDFQGFYLLKIYTEAALLPRFIAPDKIKAGDKELFNRFSGAHITEGTSMGLGFFADGYISFGKWGMLSFAFFLGYFFGLIFRAVERWMSVSPIFLFAVFTILGYAIRPDCETQTMMGYVIKSFFVYEAIVRFYAWMFKNNMGFMSLLIR